MVSLTIIPVLILTWIAADNSLASVEKEIIDANRTRVDWAGQYLDELVQRFDDLFYTLQINPDFIEYIEKEGESLSIVDIQSTLISTYYAHSRVISKLDVYNHRSGEEISVNAVSSGHITYPDIRTGKWTPIINGPVSLRLVTVSDSIYAIHSINTFLGRRMLGGMAVRINRDIINYVMAILRSDESGDVFLLNEMGELLTGSSLSVLSEETRVWIKSLDKTSSETKIYNAQNSLVFARRLGRERLTIIKTIPQDIIAASSKSILMAGIMTSGVLILVSLFLSILFSLQISKPIIKLAKTMEQTTLLDFEHVIVNSHDEVGLLEQGYNSLMQRMKDLVEKEYQSEIDLRNARLNALHAQINPHFLYNTLQLIGGMALSKKAPEIYQITRAVGDLFRYTTASEGELVSLNKELNHMGNYLMIQEMRFKGRCSVLIEVEDSIENILIPQFTLQPILENAFEHGLQPKLGKWNISIRAMRQKRGILLIIEDDGMGMKPERLHEQRSLLSQKNIMKNTINSHIGLKNVDTRLKLHFGKSSGLKLFSLLGKGTKVVLNLPDNLKEENHELQGPCNR